MLRCCKNVRSCCSIILATYCALDILRGQQKTVPADSNNDDDCDLTMLDKYEEMPFNDENSIAESLLSKQSNNFLTAMIGFGI